METDGGHVTFGYTTHACVLLSLNFSHTTGSSTEINDVIKRVT